MAPVLVVHVMTGGDDDFYEMLEQASITFARCRPQPGVIMNAGDTIELLAFGSTVVGAFATVIVKWLKACSSRKVIVTTKENEVVHVIGYSADDVEKILKAARNLAAIDTEPKSKNRKK